jgi:16S rRNA (guanine527-N7)-methyltransferase
MQSTLSQGAQALGLSLSAEHSDRLMAYMGLLTQWNRVYNLTAVREPSEIVTHHLLDCLAVVPPLARLLPDGGRLLDVGSGGGLPGVVLAIMRPDVQVSCVDTVGKKAAFVQQVAASLKLPNLRGVHARVEQLKAEPFDVVTSRAFASLADFVRLTRFHVKPGTGIWMAMKGKHPADEIAALPADTVVTAIEPLRIPGLDEERCLVLMRPA